MGGKVQSASKGFAKSSVSRADLIDCLAHFDDDIEHVAHFFGFNAKEERKPEKKSAQSKRYGVFSASAPTFTEGLDSPADQLPEARFYYVSAFEYLNSDELLTTPPPWLAVTSPVHPEDSEPDPKATFPDHIPLVPKSRLWPFLRVALGADKRTGEVDMDRVVERIASGEICRNFPYKRKSSWAANCQIIIDFDPFLLPYWDDFNEVCRTVLRLRGKSGLEIVQFEQGADGPCRDYFDPFARAKQYQPPPVGTPILLLSDLGCLGSDQTRYKAWLRFGKLLRQRGLIPISLQVCPARKWKSELRQYFQQICRDRGEKLPTRFTAIRKNRSPAGDLQETAGNQASDLLGLLSSAIRIEPGLLRAIRYLLPQEKYDVGCEAELWNHDDVESFMTACAIGNQEAREELFQQAKENFTDELRQKVTHCIKKYHAALPPEILLEELGFQDKTLLRKLVKTAYQAENQGVDSWVRRLGQRQFAGRWNNRELLALWSLVHKDELERGILVDLPPGCNPLAVPWVFGGGRDVQTFNLVQEGEQLCLRKHIEGVNDSLTQPGSVVSQYPVKLATSMVTVDKAEVTADGSITAQKKTTALKKAYLKISTTHGTPITLETDRTRLHIETMSKPAWAERIGRDRYGLFADFSAQGVEQRMRWIQPGRFMMGSPADEPERDDDEAYHEVVLAEGFWLADTACTQELWQAVMGDNPSHFADAVNLPVDSISWKDCERFLDRINQLVPGLVLCLPSEEQWEYSCRATTTTPFSFGQQVTTDQVNFNGKYPYNNGGAGEYREKTVPVKSLPCNSWGLYEMHGNVYEWCADIWREDRTEDMSIGESDEIARRVLRGGSWILDGRNVRSASRHLHDPGIRDHFIGVRFSRGP